jgi:hypothetical protein
MTGIIFTTTHSNKKYVILEPHHMFEDIWKCYPADKPPPHKATLIDCFSTDFITECINTITYDK